MDLYFWFSYILRLREGTTHVSLTSFSFSKIGIRYSGALCAPCVKASVHTSITLCNPLIEGEMKVYLQKECFLHGYAVCVPAVRPVSCRAQRFPIQQHSILVHISWNSVVTDLKVQIHSFIYSSFFYWWKILCRFLCKKILAKFSC